MPRTVFILGAGASHPYNFPLGKTLIDRILELTIISLYNKNGNFNSPNDPKKYLLQQFGPDHITQFNRLLRDSRLNSIDYFLTLNPEFIKLGVYCIGYIILKSENEFKFGDGDWYTYLWNELASHNPNNFDFKIYTFNYDRSLETFLKERLNATFYKDQKKQKEFLDAIPICHLHGKLSDIHFGKLEHIISDTTLERLSNEIKIISQVSVDNNFRSLQRDLASAEHILFLGFGFHPDNMNRIGLEKMPLIHNDNSKYIYATVKGLKSAEISSKISKIVRSKYQPLLPEKYYLDHIRIEDRDCLDFLRENFEFSNLFK